MDHALALGAGRNQHIAVVRLAVCLGIRVIILHALNQLPGAVFKPVALHNKGWAAGCQELGMGSIYSQRHIVQCCLTDIVAVAQIFTEELPHFFHALHQHGLIAVLGGNHRFSAIVQLHFSSVRIVLIEGAEALLAQILSQVSICHIAYILRMLCTHVQEHFRAAVADLFTHSLELIHILRLTIIIGALHAIFAGMNTVAAAQLTVLIKEPAVLGKPLIVKNQTGGADVVRNHVGNAIFRSHFHPGILVHNFIADGAAFSGRRCRQQIIQAFQIIAVKNGAEVAILRDDNIVFRAGLNIRNHHTGQIQITLGIHIVLVVGGIPLLSQILDPVVTEFTGVVRNRNFLLACMCSILPTVAADHGQTQQYRCHQ